MQNALGYKDERNVYRLIDRLGNVQVSPVISGSIEITIYPGGGEQRVPLAQGTKTVDINNVQEIHLDGKYPYAIVDIVQNCSGQPVTVTCHVKS